MRLPLRLLPALSALVLLGACRDRPDADSAATTDSAFARDLELAQRQVAPEVVFNDAPLGESPRPDATPAPRAESPRTRTARPTPAPRREAPPARVARTPRPTTPEPTPVEPELPQTELFPGALGQAVLAAR